MSHDNRYDDISSDQNHTEKNEEVNFILKEPDSYYPIKQQQQEKDNKKKRSVFSYLIVALVAALIGGLISAYIAPVYLYGNIIPVPESQLIYPEQQEINITPDDEIGTVEAVAKKAMKSVVGITTVQRGLSSFWGTTETQGLGSGVIVSSDGYIITNSHVVANGQADEITVLFETKGKKPGKVLWYSEVYDLAIVKANAKNLPAADLGDSDNLEVGEVAVAIGNPLGLEFQRTVTSGVISGLNRTIVLENQQRIEDLIQTDASINPGNSGGPLLNGAGKVIGINTAKISGGEGLGLSIPINVVKPIIERVINDGEFRQVYMGIQGIAVEKYEQALDINLNADKGIYIAEVVAGSPAHDSGLQAGDVLINIGNKEVNTMNDLKKKLYDYKPGDEAKLQVLRNGSKKDLKITFSERPSDW